MNTDVLFNVFIHSIVSNEEKHSIFPNCLDLIAIFGSSEILLKLKIVPSSSLLWNWLLFTPPQRQRWSETSMFIDAGRKCQGYKGLTLGLVLNP